MRRAATKRRSDGATKGGLVAGLLALTLAHGATAQTADVTVELEVFGVGGTYRPNDVVAVRLAVTSLLDEPTPCWVQWEVPNAEGDIAEYGRSVTLSPGSPVPVWLYAPIPPLTSGQTIWTVRVFEEADERRGRELGGARISPALATALPIKMVQGAIAVIGRNHMRLDEYRNKRGPWERDAPPGAHEEALVVRTMPEELPDRWEGLKMFEAVAWAEALPQNLRLDAARALREYVQRGGHLVISLPQAGNPWGLGTVGRTYFDDLMPTKAPRTEEGVSLRELMPVLSKTQLPMRDLEMSVRVFRDARGFDAVDNHYEPLIALPDGRVVAIQRTVGFGRITLVGIDLSSQLAAMKLPEPDVFWNRVLGRRQDTPTADELGAMDREDPKILSRGSANEMAIGDGRLFEETINQTREATFIMLLAVFFFGAYWLLAGPGGYWALKLKGLKHHAWLAFAATAALFTAIAWGGVRVMRAQNLELRHVTFLDHVARPPADERLEEPLYQRGVSWASLSVPRYGTARLAIESEPRQRDLLLTWWAPEKPPDRFPNVDRYTVDVGRQPSAQTIPVRATSTQLALHWLGALDPDWGGMLRASPEDPVRVERDPRTGQPYLAGTLRHDLPGPLTSVRLIWITGDRNPPPRYDVDESGAELPWLPIPPDRGRPMLNNGHMWSLGDAWHADSAWSLSTLDPPSGATTLDLAIYARYVSGHEGDGWSPANSSLGEREVVEYIEMLSLYHHLTPPKYHRAPGKGDPETMVAHRRLGRELDLSPWLSRPCVIVIGYLRGSPTPIPLTVDGERPAGEGLTVVRWIYPLPVDEDELRRP